jgi:hypothetical protein
MSTFTEIKSAASELARQMIKNNAQILDNELNTDNLSVLERSEYFQIKKLSEDVFHLSRYFVDLQKRRIEGELVLRSDGRFALNDPDGEYFTSGSYMELLVIDGPDPEDQNWLFGSVEYNHYETEKLGVGYYFMNNGGARINLKEGMTAAIRKFE